MTQRNDPIARDWRSEITVAHQKIAKFVRKTPVLHGISLGALRNVSIKFEQFQHTGSFKARGAFHSLISLENKDNGVVAASGGNHGAAVGYAAHQLGYPARIYVPEYAGKSKIDLIRRTGADLKIVPGTYADALIMAETYQAETGAAQIHAYDSINTVLGQGTLAKEWDEQDLEADTVLVAVGGGGLIAGALAWWGQSRRVVSVEPRNCPTLTNALAAKQPLDVDVSGVAVNALGARRIGNICYQLAIENQIKSCLVDDAAIVAAQKFLWHNFRQLVEPAGATALAALLSGVYRPEPDERVAVLICGANPTADPFCDSE